MEWFSHTAGKSSEKGNYSSGNAQHPLLDMDNRKQNNFVEIFSGLRMHSFT
jgi:hypothetical protein